MSSHEITALRCPSCGGADTELSQEMSFGAEFRCNHCGVTSVMIIDQTLIPLSVLMKQGEKVCTKCGRMALREAKFCQEGHALMKYCNFCGEHIAVDHRICDFCGSLYVDAQDIQLNQVYKGEVIDPSSVGSKPILKILSGVSVWLERDEWISLARNQKSVTEQGCRLLESTKARRTVINCFMVSQYERNPTIKHPRSERRLER